ncbi:hypothetical protein, partial [Thalassospira marina]
MVSDANVIKLIFFKQSPIDRRKILAIIRPHDGRRNMRLAAPVAELVDAADSKSVSLCEWEF